MNRASILILLCASLYTTALAAEEFPASVKNIDQWGRQLHEGPEAAKKAAEQLATLGPKAQPVLHDLIYALSYDEEFVAVAVSSAIVPIGAPAVSPLRLCLQDINFFIRRRAADVLGQIGPAAAPAVPELIANLKDSQFEVHEAAETALKKIGAPALPGLTRALSSPDEGLRRQLVEILGTVGPSAAPALINTLKRDDSSFVRVSSIENLGHFQPMTPAILSALILGLSDLEEGVRGAAADALSALGTAAQPAVKKLSQMVASDPDSLVRRKAQDAIAAIEPVKI